MDCVVDSSSNDSSLRCKTTNSPNILCSPFRNSAKLLNTNYSPSSISLKLGVGVHLKISFRVSFVIV